MSNRDISYVPLLTEDSSFQLVRTNPKLTGNIKIAINEKGGMWLESIKANPELSKDFYSKVPLDPNQTHAANVFRFLNSGSTPNEITFDLTEQVDSTKTSKNFKDQFDFSHYFSGVKYLASNKYDERMSYFAPLYLKKDVPDYFIIFKIKDPANFPLDEVKQKYEAGESKTDYLIDLFSKASIIKTFDLRAETIPGKYLRDYLNNPNFPTSPLSVSYGENDFTTWNGIIINEGTFGSRGELTYDLYSNSQPLKFFEENITNGFSRNGIIFPNILNLEFVFNDDSSAKYDFNRYLGVYVNAIELSKLDIDIDRAYLSRSTWENTPRFRKKFLETDEVNLTQSNPNGVIVPFKNSIVNFSEFTSTFTDSENLFINYISDKDSNLYMPNLTQPFEVEYGIEQSLNLSLIDFKLVESANLTSTGTIYSTLNNVTTTATLGSGSGLIVDILVYGGGVNTFTPNGLGTGYATATGVATTSVGGGTGLTVDITALAGVITNIVINDAGTGYNAGDVVTITGGTFPEVIIINSVNGLGEISSFTIVSGGSGYAIGDTVVINSGSADAILTITAIMSGTIVNANLTSHGYETGNLLVISSSNPDYSGEFPITKIDNNNLEYKVNTSPALGTAIGTSKKELSTGQFRFANTKIDLGLFFGQSKNLFLQDLGESTKVGGHSYGVIKIEYSGAVNTITQLTAGTGYINSLNVATSGGSGTGLTFNIIDNGAGGILSTTINQHGTGYKVGDIINISGGSGATIKITDVIQSSLNNYDEIRIYHPAGTQIDSIGKYDLIVATQAYSLIPNPGEYYIYNDYDNILGYDEFYMNGSGTASQIASALAGCINGIRNAAFSAYQYDDKVFIKLRPAGDFDSIHKISFVSPTSDYSVLTINDLYTGSQLVNTQFSFLGGSKEIGNRLILDAGHLDKINQNFESILIKSSDSWSKIRKVSQYVDEITETNSTTQALRTKTINRYKNKIVVVLEENETPTISNKEFVMKPKFRPSFGLLSFYLIKDLDFDFYSSTYTNFPNIDLYEHYFIPEGVNLLSPGIDYIVYNGNIVIYNVNAVNLFTSDSIGTGYTTAISVATTSAGGGNGLTVDITATTNGPVVSLDPLTLVPGTGYTTTPGVTTTGGSGTGLTVDITDDGLGGVSTVLINIPGNGYQVGDIITISGGGVNSTIEVDSVLDGQITSISVNNIGAGYQVGDTITIDGGTILETLTITSISENMRYPNPFSSTTYPIVTSQSFNLVIQNSYLIESGTPLVTYDPTTTSNIIPINDVDKELKEFGGFSILKDPSKVIPQNESNEYELKTKYLNGFTDTEYDFYKENESLDFALRSKIIPYITKWGIKNGKDSRDNPYRLNTELIFGRNNFSPDHEDQTQNPVNFTHEWFYVESKFGYINDESTIAQNTNYFETSLDLSKLVSDQSYFINYFTYTPTTLAGKEVADTQFRYSSLIKNSAGQYEAFFKGFKISFKDVTNPDVFGADGKPVAKENSTRFEGYKFSCILKPIKEDINDSTQQPISYKVIEHRDNKFIVIVIEVVLGDVDDLSIDPYWKIGSNPILDTANFNDHTLFTPINPAETYPFGTINGDYRITFDANAVSNVTHTLLYSLKNKKYNNLAGAYSNTKMASKLDLSITTDNTIKRLQNFNIPNYPAILPDDIVKPTANTLIFIKDTFTGFDLFLVKVEGFVPASPIVNTIDYVLNQFAHYNTQTGLVSPTVPPIPPGVNLYGIIPSGLTSIISNYYTFKVLTGGENYYERLLEKISFAKFKKYINSLNPIVQYYSYTGEGVLVDDPNFYIELPDISNIEKVNQVITNYTEDIPVQFAEQGEIGTAYEVANLTKRYELNRYNGEYEPVIQNYSTYQSNYSFKNNLINDLSLSNTRLNADVLNSMTIQNFNHIKVADSRILVLESDESYLPVYPKINEVAIGRNDYFLLRGNWDWGFHYKYLNKETNLPVSGALRVEEDDSFLAKLITLPSAIELEDFKIEYIDVNQEFNTVDISKIEIVAKETPLAIEGIINVNNVLTRYLIEDGISAKFNEYLINSNEFIGNFNSISDPNILISSYVREYIKLNILKLYDIDTNEFYSKQNNTIVSTNLQAGSNPNSIEFVFLNDKQRFTQGYNILKSLQINKKDKLILKFSFAKKQGSGLSISPKIKIKFI